MNKTKNRLENENKLENKPSRGITYVAWGKAIEQAEESAISAKKFGLKTCLISTDYKGDIFDKFIKVETKISYPAEKVFYYHLSPWDETLFLDADTIILGDLEYGFEIAKKHGIALTIAPACYLINHWNVSKEYDIKKNWNQNDIKNLPKEIIDYNAGAIFFNKNHEKMKNFINLFQKKLQKRVNWYDLKENPRINDQSILGILLYEQDINPYVLPQNWNLRPEHGMIMGFGPIKIWHSIIPIPKNFDTQQKSFWNLKPFLKK